MRACLQRAESAETACAQARAELRAGTEQRERDVARVSKETRALEMRAIAAEEASTAALRERDESTQRAAETRGLLERCMATQRRQLETEAARNRATCSAATTASTAQQARW